MPRKKKAESKKKDSEEISESGEISESAEMSELPEDLIKDRNKEKTETDSKKSKVKVNAVLVREKVMTENSDEARELYNQSRYGIIQDQKVHLSLLEALFLMEKGRLVVADGKGKEIDFDTFVKKARKVEPNFWIRYCVFKDMRNRGYIVKTALKFGADFRIYDRGVKPGEDHARWVVYPVHEGEHLTWYEFSAKNRVAHSTKKRLLIGVVDDENDVTYYEIRWMRP